MANVLTDTTVASSPLFPSASSEYEQKLNQVLQEYFNQLLASSGSQIDYIDFNTSYTKDEHLPGRLHWSTDDQTLELGMEGNAEVKLQIGQEILIRAKNESGSDITNGQIVVITGSSGQRVAIGLADKDTINEYDILAIATQDVASGGNGYFTSFGLVRDIDTSHTSEGDYIYLSDDGTFTSTMPTGVCCVWRVGITVVDNASSGVIFFAPSQVTAIKWDDLRVEPVVRGTGSNNPVFTKFFDNGSGSRGVYLYAFTDEITANQKEIFFSMQMPHNWKLGSYVSLHVHWVGNNSDTNAIPVWGLEYTFKDIGQTFGNTSIIYTTGGNIDSDGTPDTDITAGKHYLSKFPDITPDTTNDGLSAILIGRLFRFSGDASDTYNVAGNACGLLYIDAHYQIDSLGSKLEYTK